MSSSSASKHTKDDSIPSCFTDTHGVMTSTTNDIAGHRIVRQMGTVFGLTVQGRNWGVDLGALIKSSVGGEIKPITNLLYTARNKAMDRMVGECMARGGNAILAVRFDVVTMGALSQVCAYGTAAVVEEISVKERNTAGEVTGT